MVFFDDNVNSGLQALNVFAQWLGVQLEKKLNLQEPHVQSLPADAVEHLLQIPITLVFAVGTEGADQRVKDFLTNVLRLRPDRVEVRLASILKDEEKLFTGRNSPFQHGEKIPLREFLTEAGRSLMLSRGKSPEQANERSLGYGGAEALVVFPYSVPTMTITALWCRGRFRDTEWIPLVERTRRANIDGTFTGEDA